MVVTDGHATARFTAAGQVVTVHAFRCGSVTVKRSHHTGFLPERTPAALRFAAILADRRFAAPMPVWAYAIEHPDALIVIDTGVDPTYGDRSSWAGHDTSRRFLHSFLRPEIGPDETLPARLQSAGLRAADVSMVVLTHQHIDHTGTVSQFADADVFTTTAEDRAAASLGAEQWRWRSASTRIRHVDAEGAPGDLGPTLDLLRDGTVAAIHTPGHTPGSVTVRLATDEGEVWFTGDTSFTAEDMDPAAPTAGIHTDITAVRRLHTHLNTRRQNGSMLLPSHDPQVPRRLRQIGRMNT